MIRACVICRTKFSVDREEFTCSPGCSAALRAQIEAEKKDHVEYAEKDSGETEAEQARKVFDQAKKVIDVDAIAGAESRPEDLVVGIAGPEARLAAVQAVRRIVEAAELLEHPDLPPGLAATAGLLAARLLVEAYGEDIPDYGSDA